MQVQSHNIEEIVLTRGRNMLHRDKSLENNEKTNEKTMDNTYFNRSQENEIASNTEVKESGNLLSYCSWPLP